MRKYYDCNWQEIVIGDVIYIFNTVNGENRFVIFNTSPLDVRYRYDLNRRYEYDMPHLLEACILVGCTEYLIVDNILDEIRNLKIDNIIK